MQTISSYTVCHGAVKDATFENLVSAKLAAGFQPYGSPFFTKESQRTQTPSLGGYSDVIFGHQAMVKFKPDDTSK